VFIGAVVLLSFLLLLASFRAPVVALKAGLMNLLSIAAAYGVVAAVAGGGFVGGLVGIESAMPVPPFLPVMMFAILFGLSMDYEVFLLSRIREAFLGGAPAGEAVVEGVARTAQVITRMVLVPAVMQIIGDHAWWMPRRLYKLVPRIEMEGEPAHA